MDSYRVIPKLRKEKILTAAQFVCLKGSPTLNITNSCLFQCTYCYARGYRQAPREGEVYLYVNFPDLLKAELLSKKVLPQWVILKRLRIAFNLILTFPMLPMRSFESS